MSGRGRETRTCGAFVPHPDQKGTKQQRRCATCNLTELAHERALRRGSVRVGTGGAASKPEPGDPFAPRKLSINEVRRAPPLVERSMSGIAPGTRPKKPKSERGEGFIIIDARDEKRDVPDADRAGAWG